MKRNFLVLSCLLASMALSGCAASASEKPVSPGDSLMDQPVEIHFSWWGNDVRHEYTMNGVDLFESENPSITVSNKYGVWQGYEKRTKVSMESHTEADVMQINYAWLSDYSPKGDGYYNLYDLSEYIDLSNFTESDLQYGIIEGKLNALPIAFNSNEFFYNKRLWDQYGLDIPTKWEDFIEAAKVMQKDGIYPIGMVKKQVFMYLVAHFEQEEGKTFFTEDGKLNVTKEELAEIMSYYRTLIDEKVLMPIDDFSRTKFSDESVASTMCWVSDAGNYCKGLEANGGEPIIGGVIINPYAKENGWYIKPATMYAISAYTEHPEESAKLLNFLINSPEMAVLQLSEKGVPVSRSALEAVIAASSEDISYEYEASRYMKDHIDQYRVIIPIMENDDILSAFKQYGDDYIFDKISLEECSQSLYDTIVRYQGP